MTRRYTMPSWFETSVFYEIYPQSFADSNNDGIGDIPGITNKLEYVRDFGANALWINPIYDSPFADAGYDIRNYTSVAPRYGTLADVDAFLMRAHELGIRVLFDLVPGHTSEEHPWFLESTKSETNEFTDRYIWTDSWISSGDGLPFIAGVSERDATYILNFFKTQPALNFGFANPSQSWQAPVLGDTARATADSLVDVMRFWLARGVDGFRVDMADSLVKHDPGKAGTIATWQYMFDSIRPEFPQAVFVSEWGRPSESMEAGFDADFYLDWRWNGNPNGYNMLVRNTDSPIGGESDNSYFAADSNADMTGFLADYLPGYEAARSADGSFSLITCNHDTARLAPRLSERERALAFATLLTLPGAPFIYYGDEIGTRYRILPTKEGGYTRTGSRTPMQWDGSDGAGFTTSNSPYLPLDDTPDAPNVAAERERTGSLWNVMHELLALRAGRPELRTTAPFRVVSAEAGRRLFAFDRSGLRIAVNPGRGTESITIGEREPIFSIGEIDVSSARLAYLGPQSFALFTSAS